MRRAILVTVLFFCFTTTAYADIVFWNGNKLWEYCQGVQSRSQPAREGICMGYVAAIADAFADCIPGGVTVGQATDIVYNYLRDHPERRHEIASRLVQSALVEKFPCK